MRSRAGIGKTVAMGYLRVGVVQFLAVSLLWSLFRTLTPRASTVELGTATD